MDHERSMGLAILFGRERRQTVRDEQKAEIETVRRRGDFTAVQNLQATARTFQRFRKIPAEKDYEIQKHRDTRQTYSAEDMSSSSP